MKDLGKQNFDKVFQAVNKYYSYRNGALLSFCFFVLFAFPSFAQQTEKQWVDDPFAAGQASWLSLEGYDQKQIDDKIAKEEASIAKQQDLIEAERVSARVTTLDASVPPAPTVEKTLPVVDVFEVDVFAERAEKKWMSVDEAEKEMELVKKASRLQTMFGQDPHNIRFATLPDTSVKVSEGRAIQTSRVQREKLLALELEQKEQVHKAKVKKEQKIEACKALSDYRKRQLAAMESDRKTLSALREALKDLGLSNQLSFMSKSTGQRVTVDPTLKR